MRREPNGSLREAGETETVTIPRLSGCPLCSGSGRLVINLPDRGGVLNHDCPGCFGLGLVPIATRVGLAEATGFDVVGEKYAVPAGSND